MRDDPRQPPSEAEAEAPALSRREFGAVSMAAIAALAMQHPGLKAVASALGDDPTSARLVSEDSELLPDGKRTSMVIQWSGLEGYKGQQTTTMTKRATADGETIEYVITFEPPLLAPRANRSVDRIQAHYRFVHGPASGDGREDTMIVSGTVGTDVLEPVVHRVRRPRERSTTGQPSAELLKRGLELIKQHGAGGAWPRVSGANEILDWRQGERPGL